MFLRVSETLTVTHVLDAAGSKNLVSGRLPGFVQSPIDTKHTLAHYRERWYPRLINRDNHDDWTAKGSPTLERQAAERVEEILAEHQPDPLPQDVAKAVHAIVERAEAKYQ